MNTQEAIKILRNTAWLGTDEDREKTEQAVEVVAEALEQEPKMVHRETLEQVMWERDVAIEQLKELGYGLGEKIRTDEALQQEPCEDCISREWLLNAFGLSEKTRKYGGDHSGYDTLMLYEIQGVIEDAPSVVLKPKRGKWEKVPYLKEWVKCSECGSRYIFPWSHCPNCGADMRGDEEE